MEKIPLQSLEFYSERYCFQILCLTAGIRIVYLFFYNTEGHGAARLSLLGWGDYVGSWRRAWALDRIPGERERIMVGKKKSMVVWNIPLSSLVG